MHLTKDSTRSRVSGWSSTLVRSTNLLHVLLLRGLLRSQLIGRKAFGTSPFPPSYGHSGSLSAVCSPFSSSCFPYLLFFPVPRWWEEDKGWSVPRMRPWGVQDTETFPNPFLGKSPEYHYALWVSAKCHVSFITLAMIQGEWWFKKKRPTP